MSRYQRAFIVLLAFLAAVPAGAWEYAFGPTTTADQGLRRVLPYRGCIGGWPPGYVAIGTKDQWGADPDVYVVYTDLNGWPVWEMSYDVLIGNFADEGVAILELPNKGFVFLSNVLKAGVQWMPALTYIRCDGSFVRTVLYPDAASGNLWGRDLIRTRTGDPSQGTAPGDLAIAGNWQNGADEDAFLMRTDAGGGLLWNVAYDIFTSEAFNALTEATPLPGQTTGDLVAVGRYLKDFTNLQGLVARVSGDDGSTLGAQHCLVYHGDFAQEEYRSVIELQSADYFGEFAMAGKTSQAGWSDDIWVTRGTPCVQNRQSRIGDAGGIRDEEAFDLREVQVDASGAPAGSLAIAGAEGPLGGPSDGALLFVDTATLMPMGGGNVFGGALAEAFFSLAENPAGGAHPAGFVMAGKTETDWDGNGDPRDLYLVYEHPDLASCRIPWTPSGVGLTWPEEPLPYTKSVPAYEADEKAKETGWFTPVPICP